MTANRTANVLLRRRGGYTLLEVVMAVMVLLTAMSLVVKVLGWVAAERRATDRRLWASQQVANAMERVSAEPFDRVATGRVKEMTSGSGASRVLPDAEWDAEVADETAGPVPARRVTLRLRWKGRGGAWEPPVVLTSWVYPGRGR
jgi:hypothetical protein